jgi:hypothetical protein
MSLPFLSFVFIRVHSWFDFPSILNRIAYEMGGIPAARCGPENVASRKTLQKAGFVPFAHILVGAIQTNSTTNAH